MKEKIACFGLDRQFVDLLQVQRSNYIEKPEKTDTKHLFSLQIKFTPCTLFATDLNQLISIRLFCQAMSLRIPLRINLQLSQTAHIWMCHSKLTFRKFCIMASYGLINLNLFYQLHKNLFRNSIFCNTRLKIMRPLYPFVSIFKCLLFF